MRSTALALTLLQLSHPFTPVTPALQAQQADATPQVIERLFKPPDNPVAPTGLASTRDLGTIEGVVLKSTTGQPLRRALITTQRMGANDSPHTARTDSGGRFALRNLEPGEYNLWVNRDGYLGMGYGQEVPNGPGKLLKLAPGEQKKDVVFRLVPTGAGANGSRSSSSELDHLALDILSKGVESFGDDAFGIETGLGIHGVRRILVDKDIRQHH